MARERGSSQLRSHRVHCCLRVASELLIGKVANMRPSATKMMSIMLRSSRHHRRSSRYPFRRSRLLRARRVTTVSNVDVAAAVPSHTDDVNPQPRYATTLPTFLHAKCASVDGPKWARKRAAGWCSNCASSRNKARPSLRTNASRRSSS